MKLTVREALQLDEFKRASIVAGASGLDREITCVDISETPDSSAWVRANEFLITTGYSIRENLGEQLSLIEALAKANAAGLAIKFGRYIGEIPESLITVADSLDFPLISLPDDIPFIDLTYPLMQRIVNLQAESLVYSEKVYKSLTKVALESNNLETLSKALTEIIGKETIIYPYRLRKSVVNSLVGRQIFPVDVNGNIHGYISVMTEDKLSEENLIAIEHTRILAALQMINHELTHESGWNERRDFMEELLKGEYRSLELIRRRSEELNFKIDGTKYLCIIDIDSFSEYILTHQLTEEQTFAIRRRFFGIAETVFNEFVNPYGSVICFLKNDKVISLISQNDTYDLQLSEVFEQIHEKIMVDLGLSVTVGVSNPILLIESLPNAYEIIENITYVSRKMHGKGKTLFQKDGELYFLLEQMNLKDISEKIFFGLKNDKKKEELLKTLETYIECKGNMTETANKMYLHRNTLRYRINHIERVLERDISEPDTYLLLGLIVKAWKWGMLGKIKE